MKLLCVALLVFMGHQALAKTRNVKLKSETGCKEGEFQCDNDLCVSEVKLCDGRVNCVDGTDEDNCNPENIDEENEKRESRQAVCMQPCLNGGACSANNTCTCTSHWQGPTCETSACNAKVKCRRKGGVGVCGSQNCKQDVLPYRCRGPDCVCCGREPVVCRTMAKCRNRGGMCVIGRQNCKQILPYRCQGTGCVCCSKYTGRGLGRSAMEAAEPLVDIQEVDWSTSVNDLGA